SCGLNSKCEGTCKPIVVPPTLPAGRPCPGTAACAGGTHCLAPTARASMGTCGAGPAAGSACAFPINTTRGQCLPGAFCKTTPDAGEPSGVCVTQSQLGESCGVTGAPCAPGLVCASAAGKCVAGKALGEACSTSEPCQAELNCARAS